jgi:hypothetical protein
LICNPNLLKPPLFLTNSKIFREFSGGHKILGS